MKHHTEISDEVAKELGYENTSEAIKTLQGFDSTWLQALVGQMVARAIYNTKKELINQYPDLEHQIRTL